jgi:hypothetical protein
MAEFRVAMFDFMQWRHLRRLRPRCTAMQRASTPNLQPQRRLAEHRKRVFRVLHVFDGDRNLCCEHGGELRRRERLYADRYLSIRGLRWLQPEDLPGSRNMPGRRHMRSEHGDLQLPVGCQQFFVQRRQRLYSIRFLPGWRVYWGGNSMQLAPGVPRRRVVFGGSVYIPGCGRRHHGLHLPSVGKEVLLRNLCPVPDRPALLGPDPELRHS